MDQTELKNEVVAEIKKGKALKGELSQEVRNKTGMEAFQFIHRSKKEFEVAIWNYVRNCRGDKCPIWEFCPYKTMDAPCEMERTYIGFLIKLIYKLIDEGKLTEQGALIAGYHLVPLYKHLFKFKLYEMGNDELFVGNKMFPQTHPVYKEIRNITTTIIKTWTTIATVTSVEAIPDRGLLMAKATAANATEMSQDGMGYYEALSATDVTDAASVSAKMVNASYGVPEAELNKPEDDTL